MKTIAEIRVLREQLVAEAARQRRAIGLQYSSLRGPANSIARGLGVVSWLRQHPLAVGAAAAMLVVLRPRRALRVAGRGVLIWRSLQTISGFLRKMGADS